MTEIIKPMVTLNDTSSLMNESGLVGLNASMLLAAPLLNSRAIAVHDGPNNLT